MPSDNQDAYKEMYEMGERLMQMAKDGGYSPDGESEESDESEGQEPSESSSYSSKDKVSAALSMFK